MTYFHKTRIGTFYIRQKNDRWHIHFQDEDLGGYPSAHQAALDLAGGRLAMPSDDLDTALLGISGNIGDWVIAR